MTNSRRISLVVPDDLTSETSLLLSRWQVGDRGLVDADQPIVEFEGSKATFDLLSPVSGRLEYLPDRAGECCEFSAGEVFAHLLTTDRESARLGESAVAGVIAGRPGHTILDQSPAQRRLANALAIHNRRAIVSHVARSVDSDAVSVAVEGLESDAGMISVPEYVAWHAAKLLPKFAELNASVVGGEIQCFDTVNLGTVVDVTGSGMMVPVIKRANELSLDDFLIQMRELMLDSARCELSSSRCMNGTFTISNLFSQKVNIFTPILNVDQSGTLGICSPQAGTFAIVLAFDHRFISGKRAADFLNQLSKLSTKPS